MAQAIWTGTVSFGLVSVPVRLYPAVRRQDVRFHELDRLTGQRVHHQRVRSPLPDEPPARGGGVEQVVWPVVAEPPPGPAGARRPTASTPPAGSTVSAEEVVRGFEVAPNRYVAVDRAELEALDPLYFDASYYAVPGRDHARSFGLLVQAMQRTKRMALGWIVLRRKRHLAALRPQGNLLLLTTMLFADEIVPRAKLEPPVPADLTSKEKEMAALLVN